MPEVRMIPGVGVVRKNDDGTFEVVGTSAPQAMQLPVNPVRAAKEAQEAARQAAKDAQDAEDRRLKLLEWKATHNPDGSKKKDAAEGGKPMPDGVSKRYEDAINAFANLDRAVGTFKPDFAGNTLTGGLENTIQGKFDSFGTPGQAQWWADFANTDNQIRNALFGASLTAGEKAAYEATSIKPGMDPKQVQANLARRREIAADVLSRRTHFLKANGYSADAVDALAGEYGQELGGTDQRAPNEVPQANGAENKPPVVGAIDPGRLPPANMPGGNDPTPPSAPATGGSKTVPDLKTAGLAYSLMKAGAGYATVKAALGDNAQITLGQYQDAKKRLAEQPNVNPFVVNREVPLTMMEQAAGSAPVAFLANSANMATAGTLGTVLGDRFRGNLEATNELNPTAATLGQIGGGIAGAGALELGAGKVLAGGLSKIAPRIADFAYGGITGANGAEDGQRLQGAGLGALTGVIGGAVGERAMRGVGKAVRGVTNPSVQYLRSLDIPLTAGQIVGGGLKKLEDAATSIPGVGTMIERRRREGIEGLNRAAFDIGAETTGNQVQDYGSQGIAQLRQAVGDTYDNALGPVRIDAADPALAQDLGGAINYINARIPLSNDANQLALDALRARIEGSLDPVSQTMTGRNFQEAYRGLARTGRERANGEYGHEVQQAMRQGQDALAGALERQNPGAFGEFVNANTANRRANVLAKAVDLAKNQDNELFTAAQLNAADAASAKRFTGPLASAAGDRPFHELATAGQEILPSKLPNSGTADRVWTGALLGGLTGGGAGYLAGGAGGIDDGTKVGLSAAALATLGGTRRGQQLLAMALADRPDLLRTTGEAIYNRARLGSGLGAGVLTPLVVGP